MKKRIAILLISLVVAGAIATPSWLYIRESRTNAENLKAINLQVGFVRNVNPNAQIVGFEKVNDVYALYYRESGDIYAAAWIYGKWVDLGKVQIPSENATRQGTLP